MKHRVSILGILGIALVVVVLALVFLGGNNITNFEECVAAGNPVMESYPRQCRAGGVTYVEDISGRVFNCTAEQRDAEACIAIYQPVCAKVNIQCVTTPCDPVHETFSNSCEACKNSLSESYTLGECVVQ